jgi:hypothetical protein
MGLLRGTELALAKEIRSVLGWGPALKEMKEESER